MKNQSSVSENSSFQDLLKNRNKARFILSVSLIVLHGFFVGGIAFYNDWFAKPLVENSVIPIGIYLAILVMVLMVFVEFIYIYLSERFFDPLQKECNLKANEND